jgi:hypothetical protein
MMSTKQINENYAEGERMRQQREYESKRQEMELDKVLGR